MPRNTPQPWQNFASRDVEQAINDFNNSSPFFDTPDERSDTRNLADFIGNRLLDLGYRKD